MLSFYDIAWKGLLPAVVAALAWWAERSWHCRARSGSWTPLAWPLIGVAAFALGQTLPRNTRWLTPHAAHDALPWLALAAALVGSVSLMPHVPKLVPGVLRPLVVFGAFFWLFQPRIEHAWSGAEVVGWLILPGLLTALLWHWFAGDGVWSEPRAQHRDWALQGSMALLIAGGTSGVTLLMSGTQIYGELAGTICFVAGAAVLIAAARRSETLLPATLGPLLLLLATLLLLGRQYASLTTLNLILLGLALLLTAAPLPRRSDWTPLASWGFRLGLVAACGFAAVILASIRLAADMRPPGAPY